MEQTNGGDGTDERTERTDEADEVDEAGETGGAALVASEASVKALVRIRDVFVHVKPPIISKIKTYRHYIHLEDTAFGCEREPEGSEALEVTFCIRREVTGSG